MPLHVHFDCGWRRPAILGFALAVSLVSSLPLVVSCGPGPGGASQTTQGQTTEDPSHDAPTRSGVNQLQALDDLGQTATLTINEIAFHAWLALTGPQQQQGLMRVSEAEMAPTDDGKERGMLFVFSNERPLSFWMLNTVAPLDIAFIRSDGRIVKIHTMPPLTTQQFPSVEPAQFALEVRAGTFQRLGIAEGDKTQIPASVVKNAS